MRKAAFLLLLLLSAITKNNAQVFPVDKSSLNYRLVGFSFPAIAGVHSYTIEIASGNYTTDSSFKTNIFRTVETKENREICEMPAFGREYSWRTAYLQKGTVMHSQLHHFSCAIADEVDTNVNRLVILQAAEKYKDAYVFLDGSNALYDINGKPLWFLPLTGKLASKKNKVMDLKLTPQGTITFLVGQKIFEIDYNGHVLWEGPDNNKTGTDSPAHYHHEFTRLHNGHYMVLGNEFVKMKTPVYPAASAQNKAKKADSTAKGIAAFGTVVEYDESGKTVWKWRSAEYFKDIAPEYLISDLYDPLAPEGTEDVHENAFYFDEPEKAVYISFKNISSILKVKYPEGTILNVYGKLAALTHPGAGMQPFCGQHSCKITTDGHLYLYNNNACHKGDLPQILMFEQPKSPAGTLKEIWRYNCSFEDVLERKRSERREGDTGTLPTAHDVAAYGVYSKGSNLVELPDHSIFANICGPYGKTFILSPEKKIVWSALLETWNPYQRKWDDVIYYKANIITDPKDIQRLIWQSERDVH